MANNKLRTDHKEHGEYVVVVEQFNYRGWLELSRVSGSPVDLHTQVAQTVNDAMQRGATIRITLSPRVA